MSNLNQNLINSLHKFNITAPKAIDFTVCIMILCYYDKWEKTFSQERNDENAGNRSANEGAI